MRLERGIERLLFASRWLLCPLYFGLALLLVAFSVQLFRELFDLAKNLFTLHETDVILAALTLVDLTLVGGLVVMVMLAGYENYVSKLDLGEAQQSIAWLGKLDTGTLKQKVAVTLVAISAIQLLKMFMEVEAVPNDKLVLVVVIHLTFVASALVLAVMDRLMGAAPKDRP